MNTDRYTRTATTLSLLAVAAMSVTGQSVVITASTTALAICSVCAGAYFFFPNERPKTKRPVTVFCTAAVAATAAVWLLPFGYAVAVFGILALGAFFAAKPEKVSA